MVYVLVWLIAISPIRGKGNYGTRSVPQLINYSGFLVNSSDTNPITDTLSMTYSIWSNETGGSQYWSETQTNVPVIRGYFHVLLGSVNPIPEAIFDGRDLYLEVQIGSEILSPRKHLVTVAHSFHSLNADSALYAPVDTTFTNLRYLRKNRPDSTTITSTSGPGLYINRSGNSSSEVIGIKVGTSNSSTGYTYSGYFEGGGVYIGTVETGSGIVIDSVKGLHKDGIKVNYAKGDGMQIEHANNNGVYILQAYDTGVRIQNTGVDGIYVANAGENGLRIINAGYQGIAIGNAGYNGVQIGNTGWNGV